MRNEGGAQDLGEIRPGKHCSADVCQQRQSQPLEYPCNAPIAAPDLYGEDRQSDRDDSQRHWNMKQQVKGRGYRSEVGAGIDCVGHDQGKYCWIEDLP